MPLLFTLSLFFLWQKNTFQLLSNQNALAWKWMDIVAGLSLRREKEKTWLRSPPISASELGWVSSACTYGLISCRRNMSVKAGMPRARLLALEVTDSGTIRIMWASSFQPWAASWGWQQWTRWAWLSGPSVSPLSPGRPHVLVACSEGARCPDLCQPVIVGFFRFSDLRRKRTIEHLGVDWKHCNQIWIPVTSWMIWPSY